MQLFKSEWLHEDRRNERPDAYRGLRYGPRYGTVRPARTGHVQPRTADVVHASFVREREILELIARYDRAA